MLVRRDDDEQRRPGLALSHGGVREALGSLEAELHARDRAEGEVFGEVEGPAGLRLLVALLPKCSISILMAVRSAARSEAHRQDGRARWASESTAGFRRVPTAARACPGYSNWTGACARVPR